MRVFADTRIAMSKTKCLIIGLDGATFDLLDPWFEQGQLPTLAGICNRGVRGVLESVLPTISAPAWSSFMTGKNPGKHGVLCFERTLPTPFSPGDRALTDSTAIDGQTLWEVLSDAGKTVGVINVPVTYPPRKVNGFLISCFLTPPDAKQFTYPPELAAEIPDYKICIDYNTKYFFGDLGADPRDYGDAIFDEQCDVSNRRADAVIDLLKRKTPDAMMVVFKGTDDMQHFFWHRPELLLKYYQMLDRRLGEIITAAGDEADVIVMSDHGFGPSPTRCFNLTRWLIEQGWLRQATSVDATVSKTLFAVGRKIKRAVLGKKPSRFAKRVGAGLRERVEAQFDFSGLAAYGEGRGIFGVYIVENGKRIDPERLPDSPADRLRDQIIEQLRQVRDPDGGTPVFSLVQKREDRYSGKYLYKIPEIVCQFDRRFTGMIDIENPVFNNFHDAKNTGTHAAHFDGVLLAAGPSIKQSHSISGARLIDVAPTILHLLSVPIPDDVDGLVLSDLFGADSAPGTRPVQTQPAKDSSPVQEQASFSGEDQEKIEERLRALGYID